jgi:hypothetical protein
MSKQVDMKLSPKEAKAEMMPSEKDGPRYPWGLTLNLDDDALEKLGMSKLPEVGETYPLAATCEVTAVSASDTQGGGVRRSLTLQITALAPIGKAGKDPKDVLYDKAEE